MIGYTLTDRAVKTLREMARKMQRPRPYVPPVPSRRISSPGGTGGDFRLVRVKLSEHSEWLPGSATEVCTYHYDIWPLTSTVPLSPYERINDEESPLAVYYRPTELGRYVPALEGAYGIVGGTAVLVMVCGEHLATTVCDPG